MTDSERSDAARKMGQAKTQRKQNASRGNLERGRQSRWDDPEAKRKFSDAMKASWERRKAKKLLEGGG